MEFKLISWQNTCSAKPRVIFIFDEQIIGITIMKLLIPDYNSERTPASI
jgi:hypothetical protein